MKRMAGTLFHSFHILNFFTGYWLESRTRTKALEREIIQYKVTGKITSVVHRRLNKITPIIGPVLKTLV